MNVEVEQVEVDKDLKFEYIQKLCEAIESFTNNLEINNPNAFKHHGANLKYAVERDLYFYCVDNKDLYDFFRQWVRGKLPEVIELATELERDLAFYMSDYLEPKRLRVRQSKSSQQNLYWRFNNLINRVLARIRRTIEVSVFKIQLLSQAQNVDVLIYLNHPRFINFLKPILKQLPFSYQYLIVQNPEFKLRIVGERLRFSNIEKFYNLFSEWFSGIYILSSDYANRFQEMTDLYDKVYKKLKQIKPKVMIVIEGNNASDEIINQAAKQLSIPVICMEQGWSPIFHNGFRNMNYSKMLVWGEGFAELLEPYNPQQKFVVTGSHTINSETRTGKLSQILETKAVSFFLQTPHRMISQESWDSFLELTKWSAREFPEVQMLVREHPRYPIPQKEQKHLLSFPNVKLVPSTEFFLADVLDASFLTVSIYSSTILESIAAGIPPLIYNTTSMPNFCPDINAAGAGVEVKTLEEAQKAMRQFLTDEHYCQQFQPYIKKFQKKYFYQTNQQPVENIIAEIVSSAKGLVGSRE